MTYGLPSYQSFTPGGAQNPALYGVPNASQFPIAAPVAPQTTQLPTAYYQPVMQTPQPLTNPGPITTPAGPLAQSVPLGAALPPIPRPEEIAPCLFNTHIPYGNGYIPPGTSNIYNYSPAQYYNWAQPQYPAYPPPQPQPPNNPAAAPISPTEEKKPATEDKKPVTEPTKPLQETAMLTPDKTREIAGQLSSEDEALRLQGSKELARILRKDPDILSKPEYNGYAEALIIRALKTDSITRFPIMMQMRLGELRNITDNIVAELEKILSAPGQYGFEETDVRDILSVVKQEREAKQMAAANTAQNPPAVLSAQALAQRGAAPPNPAAQQLAALGQRGPMPINPAGQNTPRQMQMLQPGQRPTTIPGMQQLLQQLQQRGGGVPQGMPAQGQRLNMMTS